MLQRSARYVASQMFYDLWPTAYFAKKHVLLAQFHLVRWQFVFKVHAETIWIRRRLVNQLKFCKRNTYCGIKRNVVILWHWYELTGVGSNRNGLHNQPFCQNCAKHDVLWTSNAYMRCRCFCVYVCVAYGVPQAAFVFCGTVHSQATYNERGRCQNSIFWCGIST